MSHDAAAAFICLQISRGGPRFRGDGGSAPHSARLILQEA